MKKNLLVLGALALTSLGAFAQNLWTPPTPPAGSELVPGEKVYLFNKEAGAFLRGLGEGNSPYWGSRAGTAIEGCDTIIFQPAVESSILEGTSPLPGASTVVKWDTEWDGQTYILQNYASHIKAPRWDEVWFGLTNLTTIFTDRQNKSEENYNFFWNVVKNANGNYEISCSPKSIGIADPDLYASLTTKDENTGEILSEPAIKGGERIGVSVTDVNGEVRFEGAAEDLSYEWIIVSQETFATLDTAKMKAELALYRAAVDLKKYLDTKSAEYPEVDFTEVYNVYNNTNSTVEELQAAKAKVDPLILEWQAGQATPDNPKVLEGVIQNATFDVIGDFWGWQGTAFGAGGTTSTCAEHYEKNYNTYQDIAVELPVGIYKVGVKGFYRAGGINEDYATKEDPSVRHAKLYAVAGTDSLYTAIPSLSAAGSVTPVENGGTQQNPGSFYVPNTMADFTAFKEAGLINEVSVLVPVNNGKLRIGVVKTTKLATDWTIVDDFTLEYYGSTLAAYELYRDQIIASSPAPEDVVTDDVLYKESYLTAYTEAYNALVGATDAATISTASTKLNPALDALNANIKAYKDYQAKLAETEEWLSNAEGLDSEADSVVYLADYISGEYEPGSEEMSYPNGSALYILGEDLGSSTLDTEEIYKEIERIEAWVQAAAKCTLVGGDCTNLLVNPAFTNGTTGWIGNAALGGNKDIMTVAEVYEGVVDIYQEVKGVDPGIYSISVQAFERPAGNGNYDGTEEAKVSLYMGDLETPVQLITSDPIPAEEAVHNVNSYFETTNWDTDYLWTSPDGSISGYVPNGLWGASYAFSAERYYQECYGIVGDDGIMKIGLTSHGVKAHWVLWGNFKLKFWGKDPDAMAEVLTGKYEIAEEYLDAYGSEMTEPAYNALNDALVAAEAAVESEDFDQMSAALSAIAKATIAAGENRTAVTELTSALDALDIAITDYGETATAEALTNAGALLEKVGGDALMALTTEEVKAAVEEVKLATLKLKIPNTVTEASDENPVDLTVLIPNADFGAGANVDWAYTKNGGNGPVYANGYDGPGFEFWNGTVTNLAFDIYQTLSALPEGKYTLAADLANSYNGQTPGTTGGRGVLYASVVVGTDTTTYSVAVEPQTEDCTAKWNNYQVTFDVPADAKVIVGTKSHGTMDARWYMGDSFTLTYYGAESAKENSGDYTPIEGIEENNVVAPVAIYNLAGSRVNNLTKGINIVKMSDGSVKKVLVK